MSDAQRSTQALLSREDEARSKGGLGAGGPSDSDWWGEPLLQPRAADTFATPLHIALTLLACYFWSLVSLYAWPPRSMFEDSQSWLQCSTAIGAFHCIAADNARISRVLRTRRCALLFYGTMNAATLGWAATDALLPKSDFPMLSGAGLRALAPGGWVILVAVVSLLLFSIGLQVREACAEQRLRRPGWWLPHAFLAAVVLAMVLGAALAGGRKLHVHHYMWAGVLALLMRYESNTSVVSQAFVLGVFNEELCCGSILPFFDPPGAP